MALRRRSEVEADIGAPGQGTSPATGSWKRAARILSQGPGRECDPADTLVSDFWPPEWQGNSFLLFQAAPSVVICYGSARKRIQGGPWQEGWVGAPGLDKKALEGDLIYRAALLCQARWKILISVLPMTLPVRIMIPIRQ